MKAKKRILVMYARYGSGHKAIAEYVANYLKFNNKNVEVKLLDMTEYANKLGVIGLKAMDFVCRHRSEKLFDVCYEIMDHKISTLANNSFAKKSYDNKRLREEICSFDPHITISSHFFCSNIITYYNKLKLINSKIFTIITDYAPHEFWTKNKNLEDGYIVGNEIVKEELVKRGVESKKIYPFGLPLDISKIANLDDSEKIYKRYHLEKNIKTYLFFGGSSMGSMYYYDYFKTICKLNLNANIIFVCGRNTKLKKKCDEFLKNHQNKKVLVLGYTTDVLNLMKISDLVISKPGGATVTECLEMQLPMLLLPGIGGQEKYNARFLVRKKYAIKVRYMWSFKNNLLKMENNNSIISKMKERLQKLNKNKSVEKINNLINKM